VCPLRHEKPVAKSHRANVGAWQTDACRAEELLSPTETGRGVCATFDQPYEPHLSLSKNLSEIATKGLVKNRRLPYVPSYAAWD